MPDSMPMHTVEHMLASLGSMSVLPLHNGWLICWSHTVAIF